MSEEKDYRVGFVRSVGAMEIEVRYADCEGHGHYDEGDEFVVVNDKLNKKHARMAEIHEVLHVISWLWGLNLNENKVRALEQGICQAFPEILR